jgi:UDP-glucose 4-epimerase
MILNFEGKPAVVVLSIDRYNNIVNNKAVLEQSMNKGKVLVTGGAGYIGGHLVHELVSAGYQVVILDNLSTGKRENIHAKAIFIEGDLADHNLLQDVFASHKFEAVFHMAASLEVGESVEYPEKYFTNNVVNTYNLLNAMNEANCKKIIFSSSAAVYGEAAASPITEISPLHPNNPYGSTKLLAERAIKFYCEYSGFHAVVFRYFNACGFNLNAKILPTHHSHLIYNVLMVAKGAKPYLEVFGNDYPTFDGTCIRDYVHVSDIVLPHILALEKMQEGKRFEVYNIGTSHGHSVLQVVNSASEVLNKIIPMEVAPRRAGDAASTVADNAKLLKELGYSLKYSDLENMIKTSWEVIKY